MANKVVVKKVSVDGSKIPEPNIIKDSEPNLKPKQTKLTKKSVKTLKPNENHNLGLKNSKNRISKKAKLGILFTILGLAFFGFITFIAVNYIIVPGYKLAVVGQTLTAQATALSAELGNKDISNLESRVAVIADQVQIISNLVNEYSFLNDNDFTRGYYQNLTRVAQIAGKGQTLITNYLPEFKSLLSAAGYTVDGVQTQLAADTQQDNVSGLIKQVPQLLAIYEEAEPQVMEIIDIFNQIDVEYIPRLGSGGVQNRVKAIQMATKDFTSLSLQIKQAMAMVPELLGVPNPVSYLIIFQNEKEMRSSGGLLTAYGNMTITNGEVGDEISSVDMWDLEGFVSATLGIDTGKRNIYGQDYLMNNGCGSSYLRAQDSGLYPDLYWTMDNFKDYYDIANRYAPRKYVPYDHIIILNTFFVSDLVKLVEPITIESTGAVITSENLAKEIFAETSTASLNPEVRKLYIGEVAKVVKEKLFSLSPSDLLKLLDVGISTIQAKNIAFYSENDTMQTYFDSLGLSGRIEKDFPGDYFHLNEAQNCALKSNFYVRNTVNQSININENGTINKTINVKWTNDHIITPEDKNIISSNLDFAYRAWIRVFAPEGTKVTGNDGLGRSGYLYYQPKVYFDKVMSKQVSDSIIRFDQRRFSEQDPIKTQELNVTYDLPERLNYTPEKGYSMLLQKHPGKPAEAYKIDINHNGAVTSIELVLDRDKVIYYKEGVISVANFDTRLDVYKDLVSGLASQSAE